MKNKILYENNDAESTSDIESIDSELATAESQLEENLNLLADVLITDFLQKCFIFGEQIEATTQVITAMISYSLSMQLDQFKELFKDDLAEIEDSEVKHIYEFFIQKIQNYSKFSIEDLKRKFSLH